jgi:hypothetical protein
MRRRRAARWLRGGACALGALAAAPAAAVVIRFSVSDVPDAMPGRDLWRYSYRLDEFPYDAHWGFGVYFAPELYGPIEPPPSAGADWDVLVVQPDAQLPDAGLYDAEARFDAPSVSQPFEVTFEWLGSGSPGAQPFAVFDPSASTIQSGTTAPEPAAGAGHAAALLGLSALVHAGRTARGEGWG